MQQADYPAAGSVLRRSDATGTMRFVHFVYMVRCADGTLYTGYARDPKQREQVHNRGRGARYTASRRPVVLVYLERCRSLSHALKREHQLKGWTRIGKEALIAGIVAVRSKSTLKTRAAKAL